MPLINVPNVTLPDPHWKVGDLHAYDDLSDEGYKIGQIGLRNHEPTKSDCILMEIVFYDDKGKAQGTIFVRTVPYEEGVRLARQGTKLANRRERSRSF